VIANEQKPAAVPGWEAGTVQWARRRIAESAVEAASLGRKVVPVGPFRACFDPSTDLIWLNYAVPVWALGSTADTQAQLSQLRTLFHEHARRMRFEFIDGIWPRLTEELERFGLTLQMRVPLMWATPESFVPCLREGISVRLVQAHETSMLAKFHAVQQRSFGGGEAAATDAEIAQLQHQIANGFWRCAVAEIEGELAGVGTLVLTNTVAELAGVGTLPEFRRRGVAAALSSYLVARQFEWGGELVWLSAADALAQTVYEKIGFRVLGEQLHYIESGP
jgi:ribosomal protein S18 acetylase RimI-like enzyme